MFSPDRCRSSNLLCSPLLSSHHVWPIKALAHAVQVVGARSPHDEVVGDDGSPDEIKGRDEGRLVRFQPGHDGLHEVWPEPARVKG